ncbi:MAG TPA: hypothetical protein VFG35_07680 [Actinoplanes sp.]|nr:hypothetical protein [Actinoplanes sp.]
MNTRTCRSSVSPGAMTSGFSQANGQGRIHDVRGHLHVADTQHGHETAAS